MNKLTVLILSLLVCVSFSNGASAKTLFMGKPTHAGDVRTVFGWNATHKGFLKDRVTEQILVDLFSVSPSDRELIKPILTSIKEFDGPCPCPYNYSFEKDAMCGGNSAYSMSGGEETVCYPADVMANMLKQ